jgi:DNA-binding response OmpR family regulator
VPYDLLLLDRRLPDGDGMSILPMARRDNPDIRIIMLTARDAIDDVVNALESGADDYLVKPFRGPELIARVRACMRRPGGKILPPVEIGALSFDLQTKEIRIHDVPIAFHKLELALLEALIRRYNRVATRALLLNEVYGISDQVQANALEALVSRLRRRLLDHQAGLTIHPVRGVGYILSDSFG